MTIVTTPMSASSFVVRVSPAQVAACSYDDRPADAPSRMDEPPADCNAIKGWSFVQSTLLPKCAGSSCHDLGNDRAVVVLAPAKAYESTVGIDSRTLQTMKLIDAGRPSRSFFFRKLSNTQTAACGAEGLADAQCGGSMPLNDWFALPPEWIEETRPWIACGAKK